MDSLEKAKPFAKLGFTHLETAEIVSALNKLLASYHVHYQKLRNFHWNVVGPDFFEIHEKFETQYNIVKLNIDEVAERIRVFGKKPIGTLTSYLETSKITEIHDPLTATEMVKEILNDFEILLNQMNDVSSAAENIKDRGTQDMMNSFIRQMEKTHWMLTAFMKTEKSVLS
ncbi:Dps family protein [Wenyingzhuangia sp. 2_MG-2023]|uniref:Dps family protein n=1 Tax=Wenyingzhuangia sp. 2_MG-2023 TaxID=3062639 RepID=UPI0026E27160|nr:DNA starvation/stationary phase protection protein [Wenyingzhuangia sp. 2_MG-2023]MDO6738793.1 DNA starvation/stationary phase protection protein [Wenyingzhuangia sp. 2_MG-2023]MDO6801958.1 DNA starvation/stationary phase protection protein [Wenyingzhuangia sp. 1_MG-2023]